MNSAWAFNPTHQNEIDVDVRPQVADPHTDAVVAEGDDDPVGPHDEGDAADGRGGEEGPQTAAGEGGVAVRDGDDVINARGGSFVEVGIVDLEKVLWDRGLKGERRKGVILTEMKNASFGTYLLQNCKDWRNSTFSIL